MEKSIYVVLSQTGTLLSKMLKMLTGAEYNHSSISLTPTLEEMYSYGRLNPYNPFVGGFVKEGKNIGTFKRFNKTIAKVLEIKVSEETYNKMKHALEYMEKHKKKLKYNYWGLFSAMFKHNHEAEGRFYCSQFVRSFLEAFGVSNAEALPRVIKPIDFLNLTNKRVVYTGELSEYDCI